MVKENASEIDNKILALQVKLSDSKYEEYEIQTMVQYAEAFIKNPYGTWKEATTENKKLIQNMVFPEGFTYTIEN